jgi:hypothetical protein
MLLLRHHDGGKGHEGISLLNRAFAPYGLSISGISDGKKSVASHDDIIGTKSLKGKAS